MTQARALWKKIMGESEKGTHTVEKHKYLQIDTYFCYIIQFWVETLI